MNIQTKRPCSMEVALGRVVLAEGGVSKKTVGWT